MKLTSLVGTGSGRLGGSVWAVRNGQQIVRAFQPKVLNPKSIGQRMQRAKWKAVVQLSSVLGDVVYPFKETAGPGVSARNAFVSSLLRSEYVTFDEANNQAVINPAGIKLSPSNIAWRQGFNNTVQSGTISGTVVILPSEYKEGAVLTVVVMHNNSATGVFSISSIQSFNATSSTVNISVTPSVAPLAGDIIMMVLAVPVDQKMANTYRDLMWDETENAYTLPVMMTEYASAYRYLRTYNNTVVLQ